MQWLETIEKNLENFNIYRGTIDQYDAIEILVIAALIYYILAWMKKTRAWLLMKGLIVIGALVFVAYMSKMTTIVWIAKNLVSFAAIAIIVVLQPELRHALEGLGKKNFLGNISFSDSTRKEQEEQELERAITEVVHACFEMGRAKTGALIVFEGDESLKEIEDTGIAIDAIVSSQLLINIFEKNTPLHDGAVIMRGSRVVSATCYLPRSENPGLSKDLGTRHRAAIGVSEATDSITVVVSEETGMVSIAYEGKLERNVGPKVLQKKLMQTIAKREEEEEQSQKSGWRIRGKAKNEKTDLK